MAIKTSQTQENICDQSEVTHKVGEEMNRDVIYQRTRLISVQHHVLPVVKPSQQQTQYY